MLRRTSIILPCHSWDDFPTHVTGSDASSLLAAWTALWHPALLAATGQLPTWHQADDPPPPDQLGGELVIVPALAAGWLPEGWAEELADDSREGPPPILQIESRHQIIAEAGRRAEVDTHGTDDERAADFLALGYAYLQVELLTQSMRYASVVDPAEFTDAVVQAARATIAGDEELTARFLGQAFDLLTQARNHFYPVDFFLVDITLPGPPALLGAEFRRELAAGTPMSLLAAGELIEALARDEPATLAALREAIRNKTACVAGGAYHALRLGNLAPETLLEEFVRGGAAYQHHLGSQPEVFANFAGGLSPLLPQLITALDYQGALITSFDGSPLAASQQTKSAWRGPDGTTIDALVAPPRDTGRAETFLALAEHIGDSMQHDHVATVLLAGWPGCRSPHYEDLRRVNRFGPVLGRFVTLQTFFNETASDHWATCQADREYQRCAAAQARLSGGAPTAREVDEHGQRTRETHAALIHGLAELASGPAETPETSADEEKLAANGVERIRAAAGHTDGTPTPTRQSFVVNAWSFPRPIIALDGQQGGGTGQVHGELVLERMSPWAFGPAEPPSQTPKPLADREQLRNEHLEITINPATGGLQSIRTYRDRRTRASQQLVVRSARRTEAVSRMVAEEISIVRNDALAGAITSRGHLQNTLGGIWAQFEQTVLLPRTSRVAVVEIALDIEDRASGDRQPPRYASRLVWDEPCESISGGVSWLRRQFTARRLECPDWLEFGSAGRAVQLFPCGLPYHERVSETMLDSWLPTDSDGPRCRFALGLDGRYPQQTALGLSTPWQDCLVTGGTDAATTVGWLLHVSANNLVATHLQALATGAGGFRLRLLETEGRACEARIAAYRPIASGEKTDFHHRAIQRLHVDDGQLVVAAGPYEWLELECSWQD